jgi:hypothetical protein
MRLLYDTILLELQKEEWDEFNGKSPIVRPDVVKNKEDGEFSQRVPWHFFKVVSVGPDCTRVNIGDRVFPRPPDLNHQPQMLPVLVWKNGKKVVFYETSEANIGGVE